MKKQFSDFQIAALCRGLAQLLGAGIGTGDALALMTEDESDPALREQLTQIRRDVDDGMPLAEAFLHAGCFPAYVCGLLETGHQTGRTEESCRALADYYDDSAALKRRLRQQLLYPAVLLGVMLAVIAALLMWVLPIFNDVYARLGAGLTGVAGGLLKAGQWLLTAMPWILAAVAALAAVIALCRCIPSVRQKLSGKRFDRFMGKAVAKKVRDARFAQMFSMCVCSGMELTEALRLTASLSEDPLCEGACENCIERISNGENTAKALRAAGLLPNSECRLLEAGLRSGTADEMLQHIARRLLDESRMALETQAAKVEPALVLVTGVLVGLILLSVMLPLMNIMSTIG